ncbi:hypothetical protein GCM10009091_34730 [Pseudomonas brenneri]|uniref:Uncharacterized protein n=1 Tax=Pseudomonas brenneri TaxID=129817 RepID=A0A5B2UVQ9_9PSED|nr:hypothetical protein [Pseudomonas brenneri]KAA2230558.1 hypothetical protein F1720_11250 [Pseudomonas brenneri]TWR77434.1 hypothetical protein FJD34_17295 [Pseudomonas brenneri]GGL50080.1 hypothetical protein GCM10009091_34730 [Pseudomonas brenneri]SDU96729.1 hypothetical protein SAMN04490181_2301 [Pseudomonas brenneri]
MAIDFTKGRYSVYSGRGPMAPLIGRIDEDEFVRSDTGELLYRIDGDEVYTAGTNAKYLGRISETEEGRAMVVDHNYFAHLTIVPA